MTKRNADPQTAETGAPDRRKFKRIPTGLLAEWVTIIVVVGALLLIGVVR